MEYAINILVSIILAIITYFSINKMNNDAPELELSAPAHAAIAFLFGVLGMCFSAGYIAVKAIKRMKK